MSVSLPKSNTQHRSIDEVPFDIKEQILSFIDSPRDLLSFSLSSTNWKAAIIPYHIEYRELRIRPTPQRFATWQHLADRQDLSKNIRSVWLLSHHDLRIERCPTALVKEVINDDSVAKNDGSELFPVLVRALSTIKALQRFTWIQFTNDPGLAESVFEILGSCSNLWQLGLGQILLHKDQLGPDSLLWKLRLSNLTSLSLRGHVWSALKNDVEGSFVSMLDSASNIEELTLSYTRDSFMISSCRYLRLRKLHLWLDGGNRTDGPLPSSADPAILSFLVNHPSVEDLLWYPVDGDIGLPSGLLPSLKRIATSHRLATQLLRDESLMKERTMESISQISLGFNTMQLLGRINRSCLEQLCIWRFDNLDNIKRLGVLFPAIKSLEIPTLGIPSQEEYTLDECIDCLASFPALESIRDCTIWLALNIKGRNGVADYNDVKNFLDRCPNLKRINHWKHVSLGVDIDIVFNRDGDQITWKEELVPRSWI